MESKDPPSARGSARLSARPRDSGWIRPSIAEDLPVPKKEKDNFVRCGTHALGDSASEYRRKVYYFLEDERVETAIGFILCLNIFLMVLETNYKASCVTDGCPWSWHQIANNVFQAFYTAELLLRIWVFRWSFYKNAWHLIDLTVVIVGFVDLITAHLEAGSGDALDMVRLLRISRLLRLIRLCSFFPDLYIMIRGFIGAALAMFWGMVMISVLLLISAVITVEVIHPLNQAVQHGDQWCYEAFSTVQSCMLMFFQTVFAGDGWGVCSMPIIRMYFWTVIIFGGALVLIQLGFTNLILAVIVDRAQQSRESDLKERAKEHKKEREETYGHILRVINDIDMNGNGEITLEELDSGLIESEELQMLLGTLEMDPDLLKTLFTLVMNEERVAKVENLVGCLQKGETSDVNMQVCVMDLLLKKILKQVEGIAQSSTSTPSTADRTSIVSCASDKLFKDTTLAELQSQPPLLEAEAMDLLCKDFCANMNDQLDDKLRNLVNQMSAITAVSKEPALVMDVPKDPKVEPPQAGDNMAQNSQQRTAAEADHADSQEAEQNTDSLGASAISNSGVGDDENLLGQNGTEEGRAPRNKKVVFRSRSKKTASRNSKQQ